MPLAASRPWICLWKSTATCCASGCRPTGLEVTPPVSQEVPRIDLLPSSFLHFVCNVATPARPPWFLGLSRVTMMNLATLCKIRKSKKILLKYYLEVFGLPPTHTPKILQKYSRNSPENTLDNSGYSTNTPNILREYF